MAAVAAAVLVNSTALADTVSVPAATPATSASPVTVAPNPRALSTVICKTVTYTGSRLGGTKTCMTREQWEHNERTAQDALNDSQLRADRANPSGH